MYEDATGTNSYVPVYGYYGDAYNKCEFVIPADELAEMKGGTISKMTFYLSTPAAEAWTGNFQVFLKEVSNATISAFSGTDNATVVYEGALDGTQSTMAIEFTADYTYEGGNLLVGVYQTATGNYKSAAFTGETVSGASISGYSYSSLDGVSATARNFIPKTTFIYTPGTGVVYYRPTNLTFNDLTANAATISWTAPSEDVTGYKYQYKKATEEWSEELTTVTATSVSLTGLDAGTAYDFRVKAVYADGESKYATVSFTTDCGLTTLPFTEGFETAIPCWTLINESTANAGKFGITDVEHYEGNHSFRFSSYSSSTTGYNQYLISPEFDGSSAVAVEFYYKGNSNGAETFKVGYSTTDTNPSSFTFGDPIEVPAGTDWTLYEEAFPVGTKYVAVYYYSNYQYYLYVDNFSFTKNNGLLKPANLAESNIGTTSATLNWEGTYDNSVLQYRTAGQDMNMSAWHQVGDDKAATGTMTTYTYDLSEYSGTGFIAIRHYNVSDMFRLIVDDIEVTNAGGSVVFSENFETSGGNMPTSFSTVDLDGDGNEWNVVSNDQSYVNGNYGLSSASWMSGGVGALTPDNWLILSGIELGGTLTFAARGQDADFPAENFAVFVATESYEGIPAGEWSSEITTTANSYQITGLTPNTPYEWQVKGVVGEDETVWVSSTFSTIRENFKTFVTAGNWDVAENWYPAGVPASTDEVSIAANVTIPSGVVAVAKRAALDGGTITIKEGGQLKQGAATLKVTMEKEIAAGGNNLIATPFSGTTELSYNDGWSHVLNVTTGNYDLYGFDPTATNEWINYKNDGEHAVFTAGTNHGLVYGDGYFYANEAAQTLQFTGTTLSSFNNSMTADITYEGTRSDSFNGWKSIGNPYTCTGYITYSAAATFYKLNAAGTGFDAYENAVALAPGEGAFVKVTASGTLTYSSEPLSVEPVAAGSFYQIVLPAHGETDDQDADPSVIIFANDADNTALIESLDGQTCDVQLKGRTIYKDGDWNTICLPFDLTAEQIEASLGAGADIRAIGSVALEGNTLNISFTPEGDTSKFASGVPYIIKWASGDNIADPIFYGVEISKDLVTNNKFEYGEGKSVSFLGTYGYRKFDDANRSILFMGAANTLYYPGAGAEIGAFRAYFELEGITAGDPVTPSEPTKFVLRFDKDSADGIKNVNDNDNLNETIYNLAGQRIGKVQKGINIVNGKKVLK